MKYVKDVMLALKMFVIALLIVNMQGISGSLSLAFHGLKVQFICHSLALLRKKLNVCQGRVFFC